MVADVTIRRSALVLVSLFLMPINLAAQSQTGITGAVHDTTGAVLPGVMVEASSPVLIEKVRTATTDQSGTYRIIDLRPGVYEVRFSLPGFGTLTREGVTLTTNFVATINAEMSIGDLNETITVAGASPVVDVQNVIQQNVVTSATLDAAPTARTMEVLALSLVPGMVAGGLARPTGQDVGGTALDSRAKVGIHGGRTEDMVPMIDGVPSHATTGVSAGGINMDAGAIAEFSYELGALSAERMTGGVQVNQIPKDGGNRFSGSLFGSFSSRHMQSDNISDDLIDRGLPEVNQLNRNYDLNPSLGGPIFKDKLWFYLSTRWWGTEDYVAGMWFDQDPDDLVYTPDLNRRAVDDSDLSSASLRLTWQVNSKNKVALFLINQGRCLCYQGVSATRTPEASPRRTNDVDFLQQINWNAPLTNRILLEGSLMNFRFDQWNRPHEGQSEQTMAIRELTTGLVYRAAPGYSGILNSIQNFRGAVSYVTGSHVSKFGFQLQTGRRKVPTWVNQSVVLQLFNGQPRSIVQYATPYTVASRQNAALGFFAQDQWTVKRATINLGLRYDYHNGSVPTTTTPSTVFVPERTYEQVSDVPAWHDLSPRFGVSYDVFGSGRTAVKATLSRYVAGETVGFAQQYSQLNSSVNNVTRTWTSVSGTYNPFLDCDLTNPNANGGCGPISNRAFGTPNINTTYDPDIERGFGKRQYSWETTLGVQHEVLPGTSVNLTYYRRSYGNFLVTDNTRVTSADYDPYCITVPSDSRLPGGGGGTLCGLYDIRPAQFGQVQNRVTFAKNFGEQWEHYNGVDVTVNARLPRGARLSGGWNIGRTVTNNCFVVDSPQELLNCEAKPPFLSQVKLLGQYYLPFGFSTAMTYQSVPGPEITANYVVGNADIAPSLGRNLAQGANGTVTVPLLAPGSMYDKRLHQLDVRLTRTFAVGPVTVRGNFDVYNALNANPVLVVIGQYGPNWQRPSYVLPGRLLKIGAQIDF